MKTIKIGLLGFGTVGFGVYQILQENEELIRERLRLQTGKDYSLKIEKVLVRDPNKYDAQYQDLLTSEADEILENPSIDLVCELVSGSKEALVYMTRALEKGKHLVTANKKALFESKGQLAQLALEKSCAFRYEASVAGVIPIIRVLQESLFSDKVYEIEAILNGSTNFILTKVSQGLSYEEALDLAQEKGFLEADSSSDIKAFDALYKLGILSHIISGSFPKEEDIQRVGIDQISKEDIEEAQARGEKIKLIASLKGNFDPLSGKFQQSLSVRPQSLGPDHPLYPVDGALNGVLLKGENSGQIFLTGAGAGSRETATSVIGDIISIVRSEF